MTEQLAPKCPRCKKRHLVDLPCWKQVSPVLTPIVLAEKGTTCWLCGRPGATTADHEIPRSLGGTDALDNLLPCCASCNASRQNRRPFDPDPEPRPTGVGLSPRWRAS